MKAQRGGETGVWIKRPGQALRELIRAPSGGYLAAPAFSPDGSRLAIPTGSAQGFSIHIVGLNGADLGSATFGGSQIGLATWSADGGSVIFPGRDASGWRLWRARLARPGKLTPVAGPGWLSVRARGEELYGVRADGPGVWRIDGTPRRITPLPSPAYSNQWTIVGDAIDYVDDPFGDPPHVAESSPSPAASPRSSPRASLASLTRTWLRGRSENRRCGVRSRPQRRHRPGTAAAETRVGRARSPDKTGARCSSGLPVRSGPRVKSSVKVAPK